MRFYLDENVPNALKEMLLEAGHQAHFIREVIPEGSPDELVATKSEHDMAILISFDKDFKKIAPRVPDGQRQRFRKLSMIRLECKKPRAVDKFQRALPFIELEQSIVSLGLRQRLVIAVKNDVISIFL